MSRLVPAALLAFALAQAASPSAVRAQGADPAALVTPQETVLKNGLRVLSLTDPRAAVATFQVWYDTGSRNERPGITGISHLFEHMMFKGTKKVGPEEHARLIQAVGGVNNAFTTWDLTAYWQALPPDQLELAARLEADRMANLAITAENLKSEREVVKEERRFRVENTPIGRGVELLTKTAFGDGPYGWPTAGWMADLESMTLEDAKAYYATHYSPEKAVVIVAGPSTHEQNVKLVEKYFKGIKRGKPAPPVLPAEAPQTAERRDTLATEVQLPFLVGGFKVPPDSSADSPVIEVIANLLSNGQSSRLYRKLVYQDQTALFAGGLALPRKETGLFYAFSAVKPTTDRDALEHAFFAEFEKLATEDVGDDELAKVKKQLEAQFVFGLEQVQDRATAVGNATLVAGDPKAAGRRLERLRAVSKEDIRRVAARYLTRDNRTVVWILPAPRSAS